MIQIKQFLQISLFIIYRTNSKTTLNKSHIKICPNIQQQYISYNIYNTDSEQIYITQSQKFLQPIHNKQIIQKHTQYHSMTNKRVIEYEIDIQGYEPIKGTIKITQNQSLTLIRQRIEKQAGYKENTLVVQEPYGPFVGESTKIIILRQMNNKQKQRLTRKGTGTLYEQGSIYFQEQSIIERSISQQYMYREPELPQLVFGPVKRSFKVFSCMSSTRVLMLNFQSVKFCYSESKQDLQHPQQTIHIKQIKQISSYRKKQNYFLRILTKNGQKIDCRFVHKEICKEWVYYFHKAIDYTDYLEQRKSYSSQQSYRNFVKQLEEKDKQRNKIIRLEDCTNGITCTTSCNNTNNTHSKDGNQDLDSNNSQKNRNKNSHHSNQSSSKNHTNSHHSQSSNNQRNNSNNKNSNDKYKNTYEQSNIIIQGSRSLKFVRLIDFKVTHQIGKGAFSTVYKAERQGKIYALKQINKDKLIYENQLKYAITQLNILKKCSSSGKNKCPFIIPLSYAFQTEDYLYLAIKYLPFGTLKNVIQKRGKLTVKQSISIVSQIIVAIQYLHKNNILYRDMKPQNVLMTQQGHIYLIDFGLSIQLNQQQQFAESFVGTPLYLAPERLQGSGKINYKADIYGVGCIFYFMLHGHAPFQAESLASIIYNIKNCQLKLRQDINNDLVEDFLRKTLQTNADKRLNHMSSHPLFQKYDWNKLCKKQAQIMNLQASKSSHFCGSNGTGDHDYTQSNYPNKKINDWNYIDEGDSNASSVVGSAEKY